MGIRGLPAVTHHTIGPSSSHQVTATPKVAGWARKTAVYLLPKAREIVRAPQSLLHLGSLCLTPQIQCQMGLAHSPGKTASTEPGLQRAMTQDDTPIRSSEPISQGYNAQIRYSLGAAAPTIPSAWNTLPSAGPPHHPGLSSNVPTQDR